MEGKLYSCDTWSYMMQPRNCADNVMEWTYLINVLEAGLGRVLGEGMLWHHTKMFIFTYFYRRAIGKQTGVGIWDRFKLWFPVSRVPKLIFVATSVSGNNIRRGTWITSDEDIVNHYIKWLRPIPRSNFLRLQHLGGVNMIVVWCSPLRHT